MTPREVITAMRQFDVSTTPGQLVFADWLDEHGDPDAAYLCRLWVPPVAQWYTDPFPQWVLRYELSDRADKTDTFHRARVVAEAFVTRYLKICG